MTLNIIVAVDRNGLMAVNDRIPWRCSRDMQHFREQTLGNVVIMGRKTFQSLGKPLPDRTNIVVSRQAQPGVITCLSLDDAIQVAQQTCPTEDVYVIGGHNLYAEALPRADSLYLTLIHKDCLDTSAQSHTYFPKLAPLVLAWAKADPRFITTLYSGLECSIMKITLHNSIFQE